MLKRSNIDYNIPSGIGERAAISGYLPQYDEFAKQVYDNIISGELEEIRVAAPEGIVGKLDDICYVTNTEVHAYQVKWTNVDKKITYSIFEGLLPDIAVGWKNLKQQYPGKRVYAHLLTNKSCSTRRDIKDTTGKVLGSFSDFVYEVIVPMQTGHRVSVRWQKKSSKLKGSMKLKGAEWTDFWHSFIFTYDYVKEEVDVADKPGSRRTEDLMDINRLIMQMVAGKEKKSLASLSEILHHLNWDNRIHTIYNHDLFVSPDSYEPNSSAIKHLDKQLESKKKGYIFLEGSPGSGKSTLLTQWSKNLPNTVVRYYAFDFTNPSSTRNNDSQRGSRLTFLFDMVTMLKQRGYKVGAETLLYQDYNFLKSCFYTALDSICNKYQESGLSTIIIIDGLDHITREYSDCQQTLLSVLPSMSDIPEGVIFVLGSQHYEDLGLNDSILQEYRAKDSTIIMPLFSLEELAHLVKAILGTDNVPSEVLLQCMAKSQGHPLYLRYIINLIADKGLDVVADLDPYSNDIDLYYEHLLGDSLANADLKRFLGLIARLLGSINLGFVREWNINPQVLSEFRQHLKHLFLYNKVSGTLSFFHNSFRQYLLNKTAVSYLTDEYDENENIVYYKQLAEYVMASNVESHWSLGAYLYLAKEYDEFFKILTPETITQQIQDFRPLWHAHRDVERGTAIAKQLRDPYLLTRCLFLESQLSQQDNTEYSSLTLVDDFLNLGELQLAKIQIREDKELHCSQRSALQLARKFFLLGDKREANTLFDLSFPQFLLGAQQTYNDELRNSMETLQEWVKTATFFMSIKEIKTKFVKFEHYLSAKAKKDGEDDYDSNYILCLFEMACIEGLIQQQLWDECLSLVKGTITPYLSYYRFFTLLKLLKALNQNNITGEIVDEAFNEIVHTYNDIDGKQPNLRMAVLCKELGKSVDEVKIYLDKVAWTDLGSFYLTETLEGFTKFKQHIQYLELRSWCGYQDNPLVLAPDDFSKPENRLMVQYARMVFTLANFRGEAMRVGHTSDSQFIGLVKPYLTFFDSTGINRVNRYSYTISQQRGDFYRYMVKVASAFGPPTLSKLFSVFQAYFLSGVSKSEPKHFRKMICAFYRAGVDKNTCACLLSHLESIMMDGKDQYRQCEEAQEQGEAWLQLSVHENAVQMFHLMIMNTIGVGYRKDNQPTDFARWIAAINRYDPTHAVDRIHWLTSRLSYISSSCESNISSRAAQQLLSDTMDFDMGSGIKLSKWILEKEFTTFENVLEIILEHLLLVTITTDEYKMVFSIFTKIYLYTITSYEVNTSLMKDLVLKGFNIDDHFEDDYLPELLRCIDTQCPENFREEYKDAISKILKHEDTGVRKSLYKFQELIEAEKLLHDGEKDAAWEATLKFISDNRPAGWARYYDGGKRIEACKLLNEIDKARGRSYTFNLFADEITQCGAYATMGYLDEILPLLSENLDPKKLFQEQFAYMNRILRDESVNSADCPDITPDHIDVIELVTRLLLELANIPVNCISERAKMLLAFMVKDGHDGFVQQIESPLLTLEVGMYVWELNPNNLQKFKDVASLAAISPNYLLRIYAKRILTAMEVAAPHSPCRSLPAIYNLILQKEKELDFTQTGERSTFVQKDLTKPRNIYLVFSELVDYLSFLSGYNKENICERASQLMAHYGSLSDFTLESENKLGTHYDRIGIRYPFSRPSASAAANGLMEVAAELLDAHTLLELYDDNRFLPMDFGVIKVQSVPKPKFVQRIAKENAWRPTKEWKSSIESSPRLEGGLVEYNGMYVIGEFSTIILPDDKVPGERFFMTISYDNVQNNGYDFFGDDMRWLPSGQYNFTRSQSLAIIEQGWHLLNFHGLREKWLTINPEICKSFGWQPSDNGSFSWVDSSDRIMIQSVYWQNGNPEMRSHRNFEVSEGWIVLASADAVRSLASVGKLWIHRQLMRGHLSGNYEFPYSTYKTKPLSFDDK